MEAEIEATLADAEGPTFSIVVPTFRRPQALKKTLAALLAVDYPQTRVQIIVADDASDPTTREIAAEFTNVGVSLDVTDVGRRGAAAARNLGAARASGELVLFVDDDILVEADHLRRHVATRQRHGDILVNGAWEFAPELLSEMRQTPFGRYRLALERRFQAEAIGRDLGDGCVEMPLLGSWDLCISTELFHGLGGFDQEFPVAGAEDQDLSVRATEAGHILLLDTKIRCFHNDDRTSFEAYCQREERSARTMPYMLRKHPERFAEVPYVTANTTIGWSDPPSVVAKKSLKSVLSRPSSLVVLHRCVNVLERAGVSDRVLKRVYSTMLGLHLFRGFRSEL